LDIPDTHRKRIYSQHVNIILLTGLILRFLFLASNASAQNDSKELLSDPGAKKGTNKVDALNNLAERTYRFSVKEAQTYLDEAEYLSTKLNYKSGKAKSVKLRASLLGNKGENKMAIALAKEAATLFAGLNEYESEFNCLTIQASNHNALGNTSVSIDTYLQALHLAEKIKRLDLQALAAARLSQNFNKLNDKVNALVYASRSLLLSRHIQNAGTSGYANMAIANFASKYGQAGNAESFFRLAMRNYSHSADSDAISYGYIQFGNHFVKNYKYDSALFYYNKSLLINKKTRQIMTEASALSNIAHALQLKSDYSNALECHMEALRLRKEYGNLWLSGSSYCNIGTVYAEMHDYINALRYFNAGLDVAEAINRIDYIKYTYQRLYDFYLSQKKFKKALESNIIVSRIDDSILKTEIKQHFSDIKSKRDNEQKQRAIEFLTKENEIQKLSIKQTNLAIYVMTAATFLLIIIGVLLILQSRLKARHKQMDIEQSLLRSQMNPHFIFNALIAIQSFIYKKNSAEAAHYLTNFARLIRLVLSNSQEEHVTLKREIDTLSNYLSLQKLRFEDKFDYNLVIAPELETESVMIPPMLAQPFVENAIEHGIMGLDKPGRILINFSYDYNNVLIEVNDNGIGRDKGREMRKKADKSHESYGTQITEERIHSFNRKYSGKLRLTITDLFDEDNKPAGTKVQLSIPAQKKIHPAANKVI
jgi:hypothetical protein